MTDKHLRTLASKKGKFVYTYTRYWKPETCARHPRLLFIFGDNTQHRGKKGQAVIRDEPNAVGIPTKWKPSRASSAYFYDVQYIESTVAILNAVGVILRKLASSSYDGVVLPQNVWGTGLANLPQTSPKAFELIAQLYEDFSTLKVLTDERPSIDGLPLSVSKKLKLKRRSKNKQ